MVERQRKPSEVRCSEYGDSRMSCLNSQRGFQKRGHTSAIKSSDFGSERSGSLAIVNGSFALGEECKSNNFSGMKYADNISGMKYAAEEINFLQYNGGEFER